MGAMVAGGRQLQRSRTRGSAERVAELGKRTFRSLASTEPHSWECGEPALPEGTPPLRGGFNGAALVGVRRDRQEQAGVRAWIASTEPHSWECGEPIGSIPARRSQGASTEPHSWECGEDQAKDPASAQYLASTEPHSWECGEFSRHRLSQSFACASTEPHSWECGERDDRVKALRKNGSASTEPHSWECGEDGGGNGSGGGVAQLQRSRTRGSAERDQAAPRRPRPRELQRSRTRGSAERWRKRGWPSGGPTVLQRSRTRGSAESRSTTENIAARLAASTEPHSWECGEMTGSCTRDSLSMTSFNGAALVGVRRELEPAQELLAYDALQRSRTRGSAERWRPAALPAAHPPRLQRSRTRGSAESAVVHHLAVAVLVASTEPHSWECGEVAIGRLGCDTSSGLQRSRTRGSAERVSERNYFPPRPCSFNGAALVGVRRAAAIAGTAAGRGPASTEPHSWECGERGTPPRNPQPSKEASTEPHSWECGEEYHCAKTRPTSMCFNGAALVGVRRVLRAAVCRRTTGMASTEPHSWECGE